jgi:hypothetical protein
MTESDPVAFAELFLSRLATLSPIRPRSIAIRSGSFIVRGAPNGFKIAIAIATNTPASKTRPRTSLNRGINSPFAAKLLAKLARSNPESTRIILEIAAPADFIDQRRDWFAVQRA